ncbi:glycosyltransferase family 2 protein [Povalibacter sp.]|uniref:glycosyltransferase family 2 protein n=1 Tax=Povalibacter sp. TaxID=1962978 RepID=UPI002F3E9880
MTATVASGIRACVVIPVYNHERAIGAVLERVSVHGLHVILVDDGSNESCARELDRLSGRPAVTLQRHPTNRGKGAAVITGMRAARERGFTHALQVDADGQHALADIPRFLDEARAHPRSVICGRPVFDASIPGVRYYGRYLTHGMVWLETLSLEIRDSMCGFRLYPLEVIAPLLEPGRIGARMDFDTDIIVRLHWRGVATRWVDTRVTYPIDGVSHFRMLADNLRMISLHVRLTIGMLVRSPVLVWRRLFDRNDQ